MIIFYSPSNAFGSSHKFLHIKYFKHHIFVDICSLFAWFNLKILNFCYNEDTSSLKQVKQMHKCAFP